MKHHSDSHRKSNIQASYSYESAAENQTPFHINTRYTGISTSDKRCLVQPISSQPIPLIPVESLNITDDFIDLKELPFHIPTQRFRHIESSTTPRYIGNRLIRECSVCLLLKPESEYRAPLSKDCQHSHRTVCYDCVYHNIVMLLGSRMSDPITCPELICPARLSIEDVRQILTYHDNMALLNKYDTHLTNTLLEKMPEFIWCAYGCGSGQLHPSFAPKVDCVVCNQSTCFFHHVPWHEGLTCEEYDIFGSSDDAVTSKYLKTFAKECPKCKVNIEKNDGCDHMTCTRCWTQFCWNCLAKFGSADSLYTCPHKRTCIYYQRASIHPEQPFHEFNYRPSLRHRLRSALCTII